MTYSSKIMILMMGLSKNLKSHTSISTKYNMGTRISHIYLTYRSLQWNCEAAGTPGDGFLTVVSFSSKLTGRGYCL